MSHPTDKRSGFTLVELTIVLGIISLIAGAILVGQSLVKSAELRRIGSEVNNIKIAMDSFYGKYMALPGDIANATTLWPSATTDNGNGNSIIEFYIFTRTEDQCAFHHLGLAKMLEGTFGSGAGPNFPLEVNWNLKPSAARQEGAYYLGAQAIYEYDYGKRTGIMFGKPYLGLNLPYGGLLSVEDAYALDVKIDDGRANKGLVYASDGADQAGNACSAGLYSAGADYNQASTASHACMMVFWPK